MNRISVEEALRFAEENFPNAPNKFAELLEVEVRRCAFVGDGWCLTDGSRASVMLSSQASVSRQKFTLAHELGHLILGIPSVIGEAISDLQNARSDEEKRVNQLAAQILLPQSIARRAVRELPISLGVIKRLAKEANVSELFVARRLTFLAPELGLLKAAIVHYENNRYKWQFGTKPPMPPGRAESLLADCQQSKSQIKQVVGSKQEELVFADLIENPYFSMQTVFLQRIRASDCAVESTEATTKRLANQLLEAKEEFRNSLQGCISSMKTQSANLSVDEALALFIKRHLEEWPRWDDEFRERLLSADGQRYLRLRLQAWCLND